MVPIAVRPSLANTSPEGFLMNHSLASPYLTLPELATALRLNQEHLRTLVRDGKFPVKPIQVGKRTSKLLFSRAEVSAHFRAIADQAKAELDLYNALVEVGGLSREKAAETVFALHNGEITHEAVKADLASRVAKS